MGVNVLNPRKTRGIARITGLPVIRALVWSHHDSGRTAYFTTADHQHGYIDRRTGEWELDADADHVSSCEALFPTNTNAGSEGNRMTFPDSFKSVRGATPEEIGMSLAGFAAEVPASQAIVELGVFCGRTALQLAWGAQGGRGAHVWGIDAWDLPGNTYGPPFTDTATRLLAHKNISDLGYEPWVTLMHGFSRDIAGAWEGPQVGLLFVDADHCAQGTRDDIVLWALNLAPGAVIAVDDYHHPDWPGVADAVDALVAEGFLAPVNVLHQRLAVTRLAIQTE